MSQPLSVEERLERLERAIAAIQLYVGMDAAHGSPPSRKAPGEPFVPGLARSVSDTGHAHDAAASQDAAAAAGAEGPRTAERATSPVEIAAGPGRTREPIDWWALGHLWIGRAGLALLALGLAFLYRYAVVRGWLTPQLRVTFGLLVGATLMAVGSRLEAARARRAYGLLLLGGGVGILYLSAYAAFGFYALVAPEVALAALATITLFAISLAARRQEPVLALVGATGAYAAPLLVQTASPSMWFFAGYIVLVTAWTAGLAIRKGWRLVDWAALVGVAVLLVAGKASPASRGYPGPLLAAAVVAGLGLAAAALWREWRAVVRPAAWPRRRPEWFPGMAPDRADALSAAGLVLAAALAFPPYATAVANWDTRTAAGIYLGEAAVLALLAWALRRSARGFALQIGIVAVAPLLLGTAFLDLREFRGLFAVEALALLYVGSRLPDLRFRRIGEAIFAFVGLTYLSYASSSGGAPVPWGQTVADLAAVAAAYLAHLRADTIAGRRAFGAGALAGLLLWLLLTLSPLAGGAYWTTLSWGALGTGLLLAGVRRASPDVRWAALATLAVVALKLLLVDTARLPPGGRVVVFLGFGALFLVLGGLYRKARERG